MFVLVCLLCAFRVFRFGVSFGLFGAVLMCFMAWCGVDLVRVFLFVFFFVGASLCVGLLVLLFVCLLLLLFAICLDVYT